MTDSGTDPLLADTDGDAVGDLKELQIGTDPFNPDTDGDGSADGVEIATKQILSMEYGQVTNRPISST